MLFRFNFVSSVILALLIFLQSLSCFGQTDLKETQLTLQHKARQMLYNNYSTQDLSVDPPVFRVEKDTLIFKLGTVFVKIDKHPNLAKPPLRIPFQAQLRIESLRSFFSSPDHNYIPYWEPFLKAAEKLVAKSLDDIKTVKNSEDLNTALEKYDEEIDIVLQGAVSKFATQSNLKIKEEQIRGKLIEVQFIPVPDNAEMYIVQDFLFRSAGKNLDDTLWIDISHGNKVKINTGDWYYKARWKKDQPWQTGVLPIDNAGAYQVKMKPE